jgi:hypothetical protein
MEIPKTLSLQHLNNGMYLLFDEQRQNSSQENNGDEVNHILITLIGVPF